MGAVRAGVWGRSVCINENFDLGSMIPQVYWALLKKIPVIIMNPNENYYKNEIIPLNESIGRENFDYCNASSFLSSHF